MIRDPGTDHMSTFGVLRTYLQARASFTDAQLEFIETMFVRSHLPANDFLQRAGAVAKYLSSLSPVCRHYKVAIYTVTAGKTHAIDLDQEIRGGVTLAPERK
jgi:hypothetical protein